LFISNTTAEDIEAFHRKISTNVKKYRNNKNMSQMELSLLIGFKNSAFIGACENNANNKHFNIEQLLKISNALKIDIKNFFD
jgi:transcriptional regulator with XRE-family HTH domain